MHGEAEVELGSETGKQAQDTGEDDPGFAGLGIAVDPVRATGMRWTHPASFSDHVTGLIEVEAVTYIRGRSLPKLFIIIDEAQNLTPHEVKTVVSRAGEGAKVVLAGDAFQIDNPYLDAASNGLTYLVERFKAEQLYGHITLIKSERSTLASLAADLL